MYICIVVHIQAGLPPVKMFEAGMEADKPVVYPIYSLRFSLRLLYLQFRHIKEDDYIKVRSQAAGDSCDILATNRRQGGL
jgi:hypothetical protein